MARRMTDNRMAWIRTVEAPRPAGLTPDWSEEWEIASECRITGLLKYEDPKLIIGPQSFEPDDRGLYRYVVRFNHSVDLPSGENDLERRRREATSRGYYFKGGAAEEVISLLSLVLQCRFFKVASSSGPSELSAIPTRRENSFFHPRVPHDFHPKPFDSRARNFVTHGEPFLALVRGLEPRRHNRYALACYHYARALREIGVDTEMVFIRLVSAIEALAKDFELSEREHPLHGARYEELFGASDLSVAQHRALKELLVVDDEGTIEMTRLSARFVGFVMKYSAGAFGGGNWKAKHLKISKHRAPGFLKAIYTGRSEYLHYGEPMFLSQFVGSSRGWDIDPSLGMIADNRKFDPKKKLPYASWFENVVRICLINYLKQHQVR